MATVNIPVNEEIQKRLGKYERCRILVEDDECAIENDNNHSYVFKLPHENQSNYKLRKQIFINGIINPSVELITAPGNTIFRTPPKVEINAGDGDDTLLYQFTENCKIGTSDPISLTKWMEEFACAQFRQYGTVIVVIDQMPIEAQSKEMRSRNRIYPYITKLIPQQVLNWRFGIDGNLMWFAYKTTVDREWDDPLSKNDPRPEVQIRIINRESFIIIHEDGTKEVKNHNFGFVPVVWQAAFVSDPNQIIGDCSFFSSAKLIMSAANYLTCSNLEILKNSDPTLMIMKSALSALNTWTDDNGTVHLKKIDDSSTLPIEDGDKYPEYLVRELQLIEKGNTQYKLYMDEAIENEKNAKSVKKKGVDGSDVQQSGIETAFERDPIEANIASTASDCETLHKKNYGYGQ